MLKTKNRTSILDAPTFTGSFIEQLVGNTPLIRLPRLTDSLSETIQVLAKAEWFNPGGSIKDRAALNIIRTAQASGLLTPDKTLIDATSGNTGIGYAMIGAALGYRVKLAMSADASPERITILRSYGAELILTDPAKGTDGAIRYVQELVRTDPERYYFADQYGNPANWEAHYYTTGPEIWQQTGGRITHFIAGLGTTGTMMGVGRFLKAMNPDIKLIAIQPKGPQHGLEGLKHLETAIIPKIFDRGLIDEEMVISTTDSYKMARRLAQEEGIFAGVSGAAAVTGALRLAQNIDSGVVVTILPDAGYKYLSEKFWIE
ncbi:MAG: cysteine synthase family protein [Anaerolineales bacterium]|nr:cysteine synthase family protein [Anaerolineales bacterium]